MSDVLKWMISPVTVYVTDLQFEVLLDRVGYKCQNTKIFCMLFRGF